MYSKTYFKKPFILSIWKYIFRLSILKDDFGLK